MTADDDNRPMAVPPLEPQLVEPNTSSCTRNLEVMERPLLAGHTPSEAPVTFTADHDMKLLAKNRGNAMLRYKEKKKFRRYDKLIRYASRKARAESRKRVKGRFVKATEVPDVGTSS
ncbi:hypothetical protein RJ639_028879 [Escallonia herrerae]|uniref:CCT domain-containing protein n=1 Tax=Escallonia herrerae TaxID=1293975 RepID=A0AA89BFM0_9ASTE|nr:hypothetical protein RJ639_028879 [Escallonia herrerae]